MQAQESKILVIPNVFPAKLWHVVNNPDIPAIVWDSRGENIIIDKDLIEKQVLSPSDSSLKSCHTFRPIAFLSFIRQLYAYGFKKDPYPPTVQPNSYQFFHPNFKKNNPELLSLMIRSAPKYKRVQRDDLTAKTLPEKKNENKDVCVQCDDGEEALREEISLQQPVKPIRTVIPVFEAALEPHVKWINKGAGPPRGYNRPQVPQANYSTSLVPYSTSRRYPILNAGVPNMVYGPGHFVPALCWYRQHPMAPSFFGFYQMGCPSSTAQVPPMHRVEAASPLAQKILDPSKECLPKSCVESLSSSGSRLSFNSNDSSTSTVSAHNSPAPEGGDQPRAQPLC